MANAFTSDMIFIFVKNVKSESNKEHKEIKEKVKKLSIMKEYCKK